MEELYLPVLEGTTRPERRSINAARLVHKVGSEIEGVKTDLVDPKDFNFPLDGNDDSERDPRYTKITAEADGFFIVVPEYNHSFPGSLKRMLDSEIKNYIHKPVAFAGVAKGPFGGARAIESLVPVVRELGLVAAFTDVYFFKIKDVFDEQGNLKDEKYVDRVKKAWDELIWMAKVLKWGRENVGSQYHQV